MSMILELATPSVQDRHPSEFGPQVLGIASNVEEGLRHGAKKQIVEGPWVLQDQGSEVLREGKDAVFVGRLQHFTLPLGQPRGSGDRLALGAAAVATGVVSHGLVAAVVTPGFMATEGGRPTEGHRSERPVLLAAQGRTVARQEGLAMLAHHVGDFEPRPTYGR